MTKFEERVVDLKACGAAERLAKALKEDFYLAGGTGAALQLGHRVSLDLDLFSASNRLTLDLRRSVIERLRGSGKLEILTDEDGTLNLRVGSTSVSLFHYPYRWLHRPVGVWRGLPVAGLADIAAMKLSAVVGRGFKKDFIDLFFIGRKIGLSEMLHAGERRFRDHPNFLAQACRALVYFDDAEPEPTPRMRTRVRWDEVKDYFSREVPRYVRSRLRG